ncbi:Hsp20/alpha crystallin family protein [uncultured Methanoregula sp.]|uniref:Hsp20/alpha crystallin family protein n=1 Tax=uncultured Methanoregula sp. TaxID=1005933 RepID=UPI002AABB835|nr:Hsp20/alpha crystallin family protein [uncultured Methanoregula sp.]
MYEDPRDMFHEMDEMFDHLFARMNRGIAGSEHQVYGYKIVIPGSDGRGQVPEEPALTDRTRSEPEAEVHRIGDEVKVIVELPGATAESVGLDAREGKLVIDAEGSMNHYHSTADLPPVNVSSMQSSFRNGVLEVTFGALPEDAAPAGSVKN